ncbi:MAG TPA: hypothetical protein VH085_12030, partial [Nocardioides sp.]|nr:hypothetical protein [Nocardioides sp.]
MPRNLTDLMEQATSFAPPEPHAAADVTALAAARLRRRRGGVAGVVAVAVLVAGGLGYGVTRGHDTTPEPAARYKHGVTVGLSSAVPASFLPGYRPEPWTIPSVQHFTTGNSDLSTYASVDAHGRLIVQNFPSDKPSGLVQVRVYDHPGASPSPLQVPPSPGKNGGTSISWVPSFTDDGRLLWSPNAPLVDSGGAAFHVTDLVGGHDVAVHSSFTVGKDSFGGSPTSSANTLGVGTGAPGWGMFGQQYWFAVYDHNLPGLNGAAFTLYTA